MDCLLGDHILQKETERPFIDQFPGFWRTQSWPSHSKSNISVITSATTTIDTPLERSCYCASDDKRYSAKPFQMPKIHGPEWRKSGSKNWNRKTNRSWSVEQLWSSFFRWLTAWSLAVICCIHCKTSRVTTVMQWAKPRPRVAFVGRSCPKSISWVTSNSCSAVISRPIFKNKVSTFR